MPTTNSRPRAARVFGVILIIRRLVFELREFWKGSSQARDGVTKGANLGRLLGNDRLLFAKFTQHPILRHHQALRFLPQFALLMGEHLQ